MKKISHKISIPVIAIIITIQIITIILFNLSMKIYINKSTRNELTNSISNIENLSKTLFKGSNANSFRNNNNILSEKVQTLRNALRVSNLSLNTEILIITTKQIVLYPKTFEDSFLTEEIISKAVSELETKEEGSIAEFSIDDNNFLTTFKPLTEENKFVNLVFISSENSMKSLTKTINLLLLIILLISAGIGIIIITFVSKKISVPITKLSGYARKIGSGDFITLHKNSSSLEIYNLTHSMNEMSLQLKKYDNAQKTFLQNASHELRTPLMSIQGYAEGISTGIFSDAQKLLK